MWVWPMKCEVQPLLKEPDGLELFPSPAIARQHREATANHTGSDGYYNRLQGQRVGLLDQEQASDANFLEETTSHAE